MNLKMYISVALWVIIRISRSFATNTAANIAIKKFSRVLRFKWVGLWLPISLSSCLYREDVINSNLCFGLLTYPKKGRNTCTYFCVAPCKTALQCVKVYLGRHFSRYMFSKQLSVWNNLGVFAKNLRKWYESMDNQKSSMCCMVIYTNFFSNSSNNARRMRVSISKRITLSYLLSRENCFFFRIDISKNGASNWTHIGK